ncbi:MAG TPA: cytochrome c3 family protein [Candidatus Polarisedimenticolia bacterium]|nr:cytochrome c3 family protein [Candidatus Polarisedimenticolia bacterium]
MFRRLHPPWRVLPLLAAALLLGSLPAHAQLRRGKGLRPDTRSCLDCHKREAGEYAGRASQHRPVKEGRCETCHLRHGVVGALRLKAEDPELCVTCHAMEGQPATGKGEPPARGSHLFTHPPAASMACGACHDPHGSSRGPLLKSDPRALCAGCHDQEAHRGVSSHAAAGVDCLSCHDPHGSKQEGNLEREPGALCVSCHQGTGPALKEAHGGAFPPAASCLACHAPHASASAGLLRREVHAPMQEGGSSCAGCHAPTGESPFALSAPGDELCLTCHDDPRAAAPAGSGARVHAPAAQGECSACHDPHASDGPGLLRKKERDLCAGCHQEASRAAAAKHPHAPAAEACSGCHLPHAGGAGLLKAAVPALCEGCHAEVKTQAARAHPHPPAAQGECLTCHDPHGSDFEGALAGAPAELCGGCHDGLPAQLARRVPHPPAVKGECSACHEPHGSDAAHLVVQDVAGACASCHAGAAAGQGDTPHAPFASGECLSCHEPHAASRDGLLAMEPAALCRGCHGEVARSAAGSALHLPVRRGQCLSCHGPHGGHTSALLSRPEARTLCLSCHVDEGRTMVRQDLHVHDPFRKGECLACHAAHSSPEEGLLARAPGALCTSCHDLSQPGVAAPHKGLLTAATDCTACHEPHASGGGKLMLEAQHAPFTDGDCGVCHQAPAKGGGP